MKKAQTFQRIILDSQSLPSFIGVKAEQDFDQRAGLCQGGPGDIVVTTDPYEPMYLRYWQNLGYELPTLLTAGPFDPKMALSDLVRTKSDVQQSIRRVLNCNPRLEFFHPSNREISLTNELGIPAYMNFDFAQEFQQKNKFKELFVNARIPTLPFIDLVNYSGITWDEVVAELGPSELGYIAKKVFGSGGKSLGMISQVNCKQDFDNLDLTEGYIIEPKVQIKKEIAVHWEVTSDGSVNFIGYFGQLGEDLSYIGTKFPIVIRKSLRQKLDNGFKKLTSEIATLGGLGFMCCDVLVDQEDNIYWSDLNPRKGAILFIFDAIRRLKKTRHLGKVHILHKHFSRTRFSSFEEVQQVLGDLLDPNNDNGFVLITNPGAIQYGYLDVTCVCKIKKDTNTLMEQVMSLIF